MTTTDRLLRTLSDLDGVDYSYHRDANGWVLSHTGPNGYAVHTPADDLVAYCYRRGIDAQQPCQPERSELDGSEAPMHKEMDHE